MDIYIGHTIGICVLDSHELKVALEGRMRAARHMTVAVATALLTSALLASSVAGAMRVQGPKVIAGWKDGPVPIAASSTVAGVASLHLGAGTWVAWAKLYVTNDNGGTTFRQVMCRLGASTVFGFAGHAGTVWVGSGDSVLPGSQPMSLNTAVTFGNGGGTLSLRCAAQGADGQSGNGTSAHWMKFMAMRAGSLTLVNMASGQTSTSGSSKPHLVFGYSSQEIPLPQGSTKKIGHLKLGAGAWYVRTSFTVEEDNIETIRCRLLVGRTVKDVQEVETDQGSVVVTLDTAFSAGGSRNVSVTCKGSKNPAAPGGYGHPFVHDIRISALEAGTLVTYDSQGHPQSHGSGVPKIRFDTFTDQKVIQNRWVDVAWLDVEHGQWMFLAKTSAFVDDGLSCQLRALPDYDQVDQLGWGEVSLPFAVVHSYADGGRARLRCIPLLPGLASSYLSSIHLTGIKLGSLHNVPLD